MKCWEKGSKQEQHKKEGGETSSAFFLGFDKVYFY